MDKQYLKQAIVDNQEMVSGVEVIERDISFDFSSIATLKKVFVITGPRRCGKTFLMFQIAKSLCADTRTIVFLDFSEIFLSDYKAVHFELLLQAYFELFPEATPMFFF